MIEENGVRNDVSELCIGEGCYFDLNCCKRYRPQFSDKVRQHHSLIQSEQSVALVKSSYAGYVNKESPPPPHPLHVTRSGGASGPGPQSSIIHSGSRHSRRVDSYLSFLDFCQ